MLEERRAIERLKRGDAGGLEVLIEAHYAQAVRTAYLVVRDRALAEDVAQGAFIRAYEKIDLFDAGRAFAPWFAKVVLNDAVAVVRRHERHRVRTVSFADGGEELGALLADPGTGPPEEAEEAEDRRRVWAALEKLPPAQRAAIVQRYYLGMSEAEMAENGDASAGTIKSRLYAARKNLARFLHPRRFQHEGGPGPIATPLPNDFGRSDDRG